MAESSAPVRRDGNAGGLSPGSVVGGRFEIERAVGDDALGTILRARDQKTKRPIAVRVFAPGLIATPDAVEVLRTEIKTAASIQHRNVVATYGMGNDKQSGARFVATEWLDGQSLGEVIAEKQASQKPMSLRGAYNVVAHVEKALEAAHAKNTAHGALRPSVVFVTKSGRVKVANLGIDSAIIRTAGPAALGASEQCYLSPEVKLGQPADARSDVFGLGGLLYAMLTGRSAADDFIAPSAAHHEAGPEVDAVLLKCLAADPAERYANPEAVRQALISLAVDTQPAHDTEDFGVEVDLDVDLGTIPPPAPGPSAVAPGPMARPAPPARPGPPVRQPAAPGPQVGARVAMDQSFRAPVAAVLGAPQMSAEVDLSSLLTKITENDAPRWMIVKDNLDHGPFSGRELVNLILKGDILGDHGLLNMDTGERRKVKEAPDFVEFVEQWKLKKAASDHQVALERSAKVEKVSMVTKIAILAAAVAVVGIGVAAFLVTRPDVQQEERAEAELADLYAAGEIEITGTAGILPDPAPTGRRRRGGGGRGGASYEDAMNQVMDLGNANSTGSMSRLSPAQVAGVMNNNINRLVPCLSEGSGGGQVRIDLAIAGSGRVLGATVRNGTPGFQRCVAGRVRQVHFPSFGAPRMGASYTFNAN